MTEFENLEDITETEKFKETKSKVEKPIEISKLNFEDWKQPAINVDFSVPDPFTWPSPNKHDELTGTLTSTTLRISNLMMLKITTSIEFGTPFGILPHGLKGKTDLYVTPSFASLEQRNQIAIIVELTPDEFITDKLAQAIGYVIALLTVSGRQAPVGFLSDFRDQWVLIWVEKDGEICCAEKEADESGNVSNISRKRHCITYESI
ncbi:hypothetical protein HK098_003354 [Nowakowskiella sp. JEL0407]|nr:hypothetical protein HK098_003354 [Nowakowskiella sp. JEL0407]